MCSDYEIGSIEISDIFTCNIRIYDNVKKIPFVFINGINTRKFMKWLEDRILPRDRSDINKVLEKYNFDRYSLMDIIKVTHAGSISDQYWLKFNDNDDPNIYNLNYIMTGNKYGKDDVFYNIDEERKVKIN